MRKHHINAYAQLVTLVSCDRMCQVGWKHQQHPFAHRHHSLIRILGGEGRNWRPDDTGLRSWIVKINRIGSRLRTDIIYAAQNFFGWLCIACDAPLNFPDAGWKDG